MKNRGRPNVSARSTAAVKNWWRDFFEPLVGEVMFVSKMASSNAEVDQIVRRAKIKPPMDVLDLACGIGRHSVCFAQRGFRVTGLDYSKPFLEQAHKTARAARQKIRFVHGDMRKVSAALRCEQLRSRRLLSTRALDISRAAPTTRESYAPYTACCVRAERSSSTRSTVRRVIKRLRAPYRSAENRCLTSS